MLACLRACRWTPLHTQDRSHPNIGPSHTRNEGSVMLLPTPTPLILTVLDKLNCHHCRQIHACWQIYYPRIPSSTTHTQHPNQWQSFHYLTITEHPLYHLVIPEHPLYHLMITEHPLYHLVIPEHTHVAPKPQFDNHSIISWPENSHYISLGNHRARVIKNKTKNPKKTRTITVD